MKKTLLEMVQDLLLELESDEVNSISDTVEAEQVANLIRSSYYTIVSRRQWPFLNRVIALESPGTNETPTQLHIPDDTRRIDIVRYKTSGGCNCDGKWKRIPWVDPEEFLDIVLAFDDTCDNVQTMPLKLGDNVTCRLSDNFIYIKNDGPPTMWTSFDDEYITFDSYCSAVEDTLTNTNSLVWGRVHPDFTIEDDFVPDLPGKMFPLLEHEAALLAFYNLKGISHAKHAADARREWLYLQKNVWRQDGSPKTPDVGR